jgi:predicted secreted hydrolase
MRYIVRRNLFLLTVGAVALLGLALLFRPSGSPRLSSEVIALTSDTNTSGYARADHLRQFAYPADQGPHPEYQTEWWYYTGNLETDTGRHFGYQLTFFRRAITPTIEPRSSDWATNQIYFAHFAVTDVQANDHFFTERFSRGAAGLAGASGDPHRVWLDEWEVKQTPLPAGAPAAGNSMPASGALSPLTYTLQMRAADSGRARALNLIPQKPPVLHGDNGLSQKSAAKGNASYYASFTRLVTEGTLTVGGETFHVNGLSWMDQEFGTTGLGLDAVGWDWFSIQLGDRRDLMFFQIRQKDGSIEPLSSGTLVEPDGTPRHLAQSDVKIRVLDYWKSDRSDTSYPSRWEVSVPSQDIALTLKPFIADQEMRVSFTYWEGAVDISGSSNGAPVRGSGYVELTGYAVPMQQ